MSGWRTNPEFNAALDGIYSSYMSVKSDVEGKHDRDVRDPEIVLKIAKSLDLIPDPQKIIRVTGSKGKGTTSRMIAKILSQNVSGPVGLFVSPEEIDHNDRVRVDGKALTHDAFTTIYRWLEPHLLSAQKELKEQQYISPLGVFLLIALKHFRDENAAVIVLEAGRGAEFDEIGNIASKIGVLTSIFLEHASNIGPSIDNVARNKLHIGKNSDVLVTTDDVCEFNSRLEIVDPGRILSVSEVSPTEFRLPAWIELDRQIAIRAVEAFLGNAKVHVPNLLDASASFGLAQLHSAKLYFDGSVNLDSIDINFIRQLIDQNSNFIILRSLPDDKDVGRLQDFFSQELQTECHDIALSGTRGYLHYDDAKARGALLAEIHYEDIEGFRKIVSDLIEGLDSPVVYCMGTQTYIRLVKMACGLSVLS